MSTTTTGTLPFYCPIESAIHPEVAEAERRALSWINRFGVCRTPEEERRVAGTRSAEFYARFVPEADLEGLWITAAWVYWGFAFDDARCDEGPLAADPAAFAAMAAQVQQALEVPGPLTIRDPYAASLHDLGERFLAYSGPVQSRRFHHAHRAWLSGVQWQIGNRARKEMPTLDDYLAMRLHSAGGEPTFAMLEIAYGCDVPAAEMDSPAVCALTQMAILVAALDNDRHSFSKEATLRHTDQNVLTVLQAQQACGPEQALHEAVALRDTVMCRFLALRAKVMANGSRDLYRYLNGLGQGIRGNIDWGLRTPRYLNPAEPEAAHARTIERLAWADEPVTGDLDPRSLPSVSWWWQDLSL
ncbi:terpene synthase family protein [Streptomyces marispadix]|uniref:Terpene synthase n=1 Tax=Streptomyces marispadix TaxID=2922868 RepID=A0ABS9T5G9_9ACTN|nr:hypothetical protein [Streptomyces marispadix]MCH6163767.1 hypothetical protein [Streptomyces marispadix]